MNVNKGIRIFKHKIDKRYDVLIKGNRYYMSEDAHLPHGVCLDCGVLTKAGREYLIDRPEVCLADAPKGVATKIKKIIEEENSERSEV